MNYLNYTLRKQRNVKAMQEKKIMQILKKIFPVGIHLTRVWCLPSVFSSWIWLWLFISSRSRCGSSNFCWSHMYNLHLTLDGDSIAFRRVGPLGFPWEAMFSLLGKLWVCSPAPAPPILVCPSSFPITYSFWWTSCPLQGRGQLIYEGQLIYALSCMVLLETLCESWGWVWSWLPLVALISNPSASLASVE